MIQLTAEHLSCPREFYQRLYELSTNKYNAHKNKYNASFIQCLKLFLEGRHDCLERQCLEAEDISQEKGPFSQHQILTAARKKIHYG